MLPPMTIVLAWIVVIEAIICLTLMGIAFRQKTKRDDAEDELQTSNFDLELVMKEKGRLALLNTQHARENADLEQRLAVMTRDAEYWRKKASEKDVSES